MECYDYYEWRRIVMPIGKIPKKCKQCGYSWMSLKESPKECPDCKSRKWNKE